jgi:hypothetical protein
MLKVILVLIMLGGAIALFGLITSNEEYKD